MKDKLILLIEDNPTDERLTLRALRKNNIMNEVVVACDGAEAVDYLFGQGSHEGRDVRDVPALIVLDINIPKIGGLEVLQRIRADERTRLIPVVVLTSLEDPEVMRQAYAHGANSYVRKPVDAIEFTDTILNLGMYWLLLNEPPLKPIAV